MVFSLSIILTVLLISASLGGLLGWLFSRQNTKAKRQLLQEKINQLNLQISDYKDQYFSNLEDKNKEILEVKFQYEKQLEKREKEREALRSEKEFLGKELAIKNSDLEHLAERNREQKEEVEKLQKKFSEAFENLAQKILEQKSEKFTLQNKENLNSILQPLQEKIKTFEEKVTRNNNDFISRHAELGKQLQLLNEQNLKISEEANNLTKALKGESKTQGNWGELILERVLEKSGLEKGREYEIQQAYKDAQGNRVLPDVVINLPNDKKMVIDSKVSLKAYENYVNAKEKEKKEAYLKAHLKSLNTHILQLSAKKYEDLHQGKSPDFVLLFIPVEPALYVAQNTDSSFFYTAFQKNILLVSPTTLLSTLRTIDALWSNEKQQQNAVEIAEHAASLYHKFKNLLEDLEGLGSRIKASSTAYNTAMKKLTGQQNLIKDISKLEELGISPKQKISQNWLKKANNNTAENT